MYANATLHISFSGNDYLIFHSNNSFKNCKQRVNKLDQRKHCHAYQLTNLFIYPFFISTTK